MALGIRCYDQLKVIGRYFILLPFDLFITQNDEWPMVILTVDDYQVRVHPPGLYADRSNQPIASQYRGLGTPVFLRSPKICWRTTEKSLKSTCW